MSVGLSATVTEGLALSLHTSDVIFQLAFGVK